MMIEDATTRVASGMTDHEPRRVTEKLAEDVSQRIDRMETSLANLATLAGPAKNIAEALAQIAERNHNA